MAFCMYCGKQLEDGTLCDCPEAVAEQQENKEKMEETSMGQPETGWNQVTPMEQQKTGWNQEMSMGQGMNPNQGNPMGQQGMNPNQGNPMGQGMNPNQGMPMGQASMNQMYNQNNIQMEQLKQKSGAFLTDTFQAWLSIVKAPVTAGKQLVNENKFQAGIGLLIIQALLTTIFGLILCGTINSGLKVMSYSKDGYTINLFLAFILSLAGSVIMSAARIGLLYGGTKIFHGTADWKQIACVCGVRAVGSSLMQILSIVIYFLNPGYGVILFAFACTLGLIFMIPEVLECLGVSKDKGLYMILGVVVLSFVILYIVYRIGLPMYIPDGITSSWSNLLGKSNSILNMFD